jgi:hypothetical protein
MATFPWTGWQKSSGLGGNIPMDYVATFPWTGWQKSVEYARPRAMTRISRFAALAPANADNPGEAAA